MSATKHEFNFAMTCEGCSNAAKRVLAKIGVADDCIEVDMAKKKLFVTSDQSPDVLLQTIRKTGKETDYVGAA